MSCTYLPDSIVNMKRKPISTSLSKMIAVLAIILLCLTSCTTAKDIQQSPEAAEGGYSLNTLLICVENKEDTKAINSIFEKYNLEVLYDYSNFMIYAVKLDHTYTSEELASLISELEKEKPIIAVERDHIYSIDAQLSTNY